MRSRSMPTPLVELPCGSASMSSVFRSATASEAARLTAVVVLPTPPFWFAIARTSAMGTRHVPARRDRINAALAAGNLVSDPAPATRYSDVGQRRQSDDTG